MDLSKYITDNLDDLIENPDEFLEKSTSIIINSTNEDVSEEDILGELHQSFYEKNFEKGSVIQINKNLKPKITFDSVNTIYEFEKINIHDSIENTDSSGFIDCDNTEVKNQEENNEDEDIVSDDEPVQDFTQRFIEAEKSDDEDDELNEILDDGTSFYFNLMNVFMQYYNDKFEKHENFFSGIKDFKKDTSSAMELFFEAILEFNQLKDKINKDIEDEEMKDNQESLNNLALKFYFNNTDKEKVSNLFEIWEGQIYCLEISEYKIISPSLIVCLNYILSNNLFEKKWNIFTLKDY